MKKIFSVCMAVMAMAFYGCGSTPEPVAEPTQPVGPAAPLEVQADDFEIVVPNGVAEERLQTLPFQIAVGLIARDEKYSNDKMSTKSWKIMLDAIQSAFIYTKRFPLGVVQYGLHDRENREATERGLQNLEEFDASQMKQAKYLLNISASIHVKTIRISENRSRRGQTMLKLTCTPLVAATRAPVDWMEPFEIEVAMRGERNAGIVTEVQRDNTYKGLAEQASKMLMEKIYTAMPSGGKVERIRGKRVLVNASRATGLIPGMDKLVVYAIDQDGFRTGLFLADVRTLAKEGKSELQITHQADNEEAVEIIKKLRADYDSAAMEYKFYAVVASYQDAFKSVSILEAE